jgi:hypothetical protein
MRPRGSATTPRSGKIKPAIPGELARPRAGVQAHAGPRSVGGCDTPARQSTNPSPPTTRAIPMKLVAGIRSPRVGEDGCAREREAHADQVVLRQVNAASANDQDHPGRGCYPPNCGAGSRPAPPGTRGEAPYGHVYRWDLDGGHAAKRIPSPVRRCLQVSGQYLPLLM